MEQHYNPVRVIFGENSLSVLCDEIKKIGNKCLFVSQKNNDAMINLSSKVFNKMKENGIEITEFSDIRPNPLVSDLEKGMTLVRENCFDVVVALGGGSVIDTAKVISFSNKIEMNFENIFKSKVVISNCNKLPLIAIPTTAGTGSHCTQAAVISDENNIKHTIMSFDFFPKVAIVDYSLTMSLPNGLTASTGFDAFCHLTEAYINGKLSDYTKISTVVAIKDIVEYLPKLLKDNCIEYRAKLCVADTIAGITLSNGGANVPHSFGEVLSSYVYRINHGCSLAIIYPLFIENYYNHAIYGERIKEVVDVLNIKNKQVSNGKEAKQLIIDFIESIGLKYRLDEYNLTDVEYSNISNELLNQKRFPTDDVKTIINDLISR